MNKICAIKQRHYRFVSVPKQWEAMMQDKYGITQNQCSKTYKKGVCWLFAESETVFDKLGNVCKSSRKAYNTQLHTEFSYQNAYDVHCQLVHLEMSMQQNGAVVQLPLSILLQPAKVVFSYNEYGDLASASDGKVESTFEYKYDKNGNWITRYQIANGKCIEIIVRQLTYSEAEKTVAESDVEDEIAENEELVNVNDAEPEDANEVDDEFEEYADVDNEEEIEEELSQEESIEEPLESSDDIIGKNVSHTQFGVGEIIKYEDQGVKQYVSVSFPIGVKRFIYPDAFERGFLEWL